jgi:RimJ/RimL family protein N-acetyltransferase
MSDRDFNLQAELSNNIVRIRPLQQSDFEELYAIAADPLLWEQHPNPDRWKRGVFEIFFRGAMESKGAFLVMDALSGMTIGTSRFYGYEPELKRINLGYTFVSRECWGKGHNPALKSLMLNYAFQWVEEVYLHIGEVNIRSQKSIESIGARKVEERLIEYYGEGYIRNFVYLIDRKSWFENKKPA